MALARLHGQQLTGSSPGVDIDWEYPGCVHRSFDYSILSLSITFWLLWYPF